MKSRVRWFERSASPSSAESLVEKWNESNAGWRACSRTVVVRHLFLSQLVSFVIIFISFFPLYYSWCDFVSPLLFICLYYCFFHFIIHIVVVFHFIIHIVKFFFTSLLIFYCCFVSFYYLFFWLYCDFFYFTIHFSFILLRFSYFTINCLFILLFFLLYFFILIK